MSQPLLTVNELAAYLNISRWTAYRLLREDLIPAYRIGGQLRIKQEHVDAYLEANLEPGASRQQRPHLLRAVGDDTQ